MTDGRADVTDRSAGAESTPSRRSVLGAGLALGVGLALTGCASGTRGRGLPDVPWESANAPPKPRPTRPYTRPTTPTPSAPTVAGVFPELRSRTMWTSAGLANPREAFAMRGIQRITVHHDGMPAVSLRSSGDVADRLAIIRRGHASKGWADIGYHYIVDPLGNVWEGRPESYQGAHVKDQNEHNLGVLVLGNFEVQRPTAEALGSLERLLAFQMRRNRVALREVRTHRELAPTACPGRNLQPQVDRLRLASRELQAFA